MRWTQPSGRNERDPRVGIVVHERGRVAKAMFGKRVPDSRVGVGRREVVSFGDVSCGFGGDDGVEDFVDVGEEGRVWVQVLCYEDTGAGEEDVVPFVLEGGALGRGEGGERGEGVDGDVGGGFGGEGVVGGGWICDEGFED